MLNDIKLSECIKAFEYPFKYVQIKLKKLHIFLSFATVDGADYCLSCQHGRKQVNRKILKMKKSHYLTVTNC